MASDFPTSLDKLLDTYDERRRVDTARDKKSKDDHTRFLDDFAQLRREVVRPVFEVTGKLLADRNHGFNISETEFAVDGAGKVTEAGISLEILPAGMAAPTRADHARSLSLTTRHYSKTVLVNVGKPLDVGGAPGSKGAYALERINRNLVEEEVVKLVGAVMTAP